MKQSQNYVVPQSTKYRNYSVYDNTENSLFFAWSDAPALFSLTKMVNGRGGGEMVGERDRDMCANLPTSTLHSTHTHSVASLPLFFNFYRLFLYDYIAKQSDSEEAKRMSNMMKSI